MALDNQSRLRHGPQRALESPSEIKDLSQHMLTHESPHLRLVRVKQPLHQKQTVRTVQHETTQVLQHQILATAQLRVQLLQYLHQQLQQEIGLDLRLQRVVGLRLSRRRKELGRRGGAWVRGDLDRLEESRQALQGQAGRFYR